MTLYRADTIVACATPPGRGAIAIVRLSGRDALDVAGGVFQPTTPGPIDPWRMRLGKVLAPDGTTAIDEALGVYFPGPNSYSGENSFEIHCHGAPVIVEQVLASAVASGARAAERGEFTRRAVLNGKLDLIQAEAVADLIESRMAAGATAAWRQLQGALSEELSEIRGELLSVLAEIEAEVDFTDDELPDADFDLRCGAIAAVVFRIETLLVGFAASRRQREGVRVVFTGRPNAGKSSLVNRLLGSGRMIVSDEPGTTRDTVEESVEIGGIAFILVDTAGLRDAQGVAETLAVERAQKAVEEADLRVLVLDSSVDPDAGGDSFWERVLGPDAIVVLNKSDLPCGIPPARRALFEASGAILKETSARTGAGCPLLAETIVHAARIKTEVDATSISRIRHRAALERAIAPLRRAHRLAGAEDACELAAAEIRAALAEIAAIASPVDNEEVLDRIFSEFCIGK